MNSNLTISPRRKSRDKKNNNIEVSGSPVKRSFLNSAENSPIKSPKRQVNSLPVTPEKAESKENINDGGILSPLGFKKIGLGSPPSAQPNKVKVSWKTRWQGSTQIVNGDVDGGDKSKKKRKQNEASKLLDDEGVIQMLNRVPSVHGVMPKVDSNSSSRVQRARASAPKQKVQKKIEKKKTEATVLKKVNKEDLKEVIKLKSEPLSPEKPIFPNNMPSTDFGGATPIKIDSGSIPGESFMSPKRAAKKVGSFELEENLSLIKMTDDEDCFVHLTELPSEQLELLMGCDIRFSLPVQGAPSKDKIPSTSQASKPKENGSSNGSLVAPKPMIEVKPKPPQSADISKATPTVSLHNVLSNPHVKERIQAQEIMNIRSQPAFYKLPPVPVPDQQGEVEDRLQELLKQCQGDQGDVRQPSNLIPGQYNHIFVRFYENFAQITLSSPRTKLKGSLNPAMMDEFSHALNFASESKKVRGVLVNGVGNIFCQGVDLTFLSSENQVERRRNNAIQLASAVERLVLSLINFPKLLVAAVNGSATGLGMTMLPLFDIVYANDKATFSTFYSRLGQIPEGAASVNFNQLKGGALAEMMLTGRSLSADQMKQEGVVSQIFFPGRLMEEVIPRMSKTCSESNPGLHWNKLLLKQHQKSQIEQVISGETELLKEIWSSKEFHVNLVKFVNTEKCLEFQKPTS